MSPSTHYTASPLPSLDGLNVLLVEDTWIVAQSYAGLLEPLGVNVIGPTATLAAAHGLLDDGTIDAALVDINLKGETAYELIDLLCERHIPVIVVTGYETLPRLTDKVEVVLNKPIRAEHLLRTLRGIVASATPIRRQA